MGWLRPDGRKADQLRTAEFQRRFTCPPAGSVLASQGGTMVLCTVSVQEGVPRWREAECPGQGWLSAEYRLLPGSTVRRQPRELLKLSGRTQELQRLIGRSLRAALDFEALGPRTLLVDCDVLQAEAGTRTTSITGAYVALVDAVNLLVQQGLLERSPLQRQIAAISVGLIEGEAFLDLDYPEDVQAEVDLNVVMDDQLQLIEIQGTAEAAPFDRQQLNRVLDLAEKGISELLVLQRQSLQD